MFTKKITDSDAFTGMPSSAQALYFHLNQCADDDGFNNQVAIAMFKAHASVDDLKVLLAKKYVIQFESGVIVIKHWRMHNTLRKDRYTPTNFQEELAQLGIKENGTYTLGCQAVAKRLPNGCPSIGKDSVVEDSVVEENIVDISPTPSPKPTRHKYGMYNNVLLTDDEYAKLQSEFPHDYTDRIDRLSEYLESTGKKYKSHIATIRAWARREKTTQNNTKEKSSNPFLDVLMEE